MKKILIILLGMLLIPLASALIVSPAILEVNYEPEQEINVTIINDISQDIVVELSFESYENNIDYTNNFKIKGVESNKIEVPAGASKTLFFDLIMPELEKFGDQRFAIIRFYQVPLVQSEMAATVAILIPVETNVPYPETYVKIDLNEPGVVKQGDEILFTAVLTQLGQNVINEIDGNFIVSGNGVQDVVAINPLNLFLPAESQTVQASYNTLELEPGKYNLSLSLNYDGNSKESDPAKLIVGTESVEILDFNPKNLNGNSVNTGTFTLFSLWVEDLDIDLSMDLLKDGNVIKSYKFGSYTLPVNEEKVISNGIDLTDVPGGSYTARVKVNVGEEIVTKDFEVAVSNATTNTVSENDNPWLLYISIALCVIAVILFIIYLIKRKRDEENNYLGSGF